MKIGINIRIMGPQSSRETLLSLLQTAESIGVESAWIVDHIAIPPDDAEGSDGRYLDPITTLAWMAGQTRSIKIGTSVLVLPYRPKLPTAKAVATIQELSQDRLLLGVGVGWMEPEFKALGVDRRQRGRITDDTLAFLHECFNNDVVTANGQAFLFRPQPPRPPIYIGGAAPHAIERAIAWGDGWLPMGRLAKLVPEISAYKERSAEQTGRAGEVVMFAGAGDELAATRDMLAEHAEAGVDRVILGRKYHAADDWQTTFGILEALLK